MTETTEKIDFLFEKYSQTFTGNGDYCFDYVNLQHFRVAMEEYCQSKSQPLEERAQAQKQKIEDLNETVEYWMNSCANYQGELREREERIKELEEKFYDYKRAHGKSLDNASSNMAKLEIKVIEAHNKAIQQCIDTVIGDPLEYDPIFGAFVMIAKSKLEKRKL